MFITAPPWYVWFDGVAGAATLAVVGFIVKRFWLRPEKTIEMKNAVLAGSVTSSQVAAGNNITQMSVVHHHHIPESPEAELVVTQPDPVKIFQSLEGLPPYDIDHAREKFIGLPVLWRIAFANVARLGNDTWHFSGSFEDPQHGSAVIWFELPSVPPELKIAYKGTPIWVRGTIKRFHYSSIIELDNDPELLKIQHESGTAATNSAGPTVSPTIDTSQRSHYHGESAKEDQTMVVPITRRKLNVVGKKGRIAWLDEAGNAFFEPEADGKLKAVIAEFRNEPGEFSVMTWHHVRASIAFYDEQGAEIADVGRAAWLDGHGSTVDFASHVTRKLIVAVLDDRWLSFDGDDAKPVPPNAKRAKIVLQDDRKFCLPFMLDFDLSACAVGSLISLTPPTNR